LVIRTKADLLSKGWFALEVGAALLTFWVGGLLVDLLGDIGLGIELLLRIIAFGIAVFLPALLFGLPAVRVKWSIRGQEVTGSHGYLDFRTQSEVAFGVEMVTVTNSLLAVLLLRHAVKQGAVLHVTLLPHGAIRLKHQNGTPDARIDEAALRIEMPLKSSGHDEQQSRVFGSFVPAVLNSGHDSVGLKYTAISTRNGQSNHVLRPSSDVSKLEIWG
jgi:hypothetical protein